MHPVLLNIFDISHIILAEDEFLSEGESWDDFEECLPGETSGDQDKGF